MWKCNLFNIFSISKSYNYTKKNQIHNQRYDDLNQYQYTIYKQFNMDKHSNSHISQTLLRMFFALTSNNYDIQKGIKKVYNIMQLFFLFIIILK